MHQFVSARLLTLVGVLLVAEYGLSTLFGVSGTPPTLLYLAVLDYAFFWNWERIPFFALFIGMVRDLAGGHLVGIETLSLALTGILLYFAVLKLERENVWVRLGITFIFVLLTDILAVGLGRWLEVGRGFSWNLTGGIFCTTFVTTSLAPAFFWFTNRWFKRIPLLKQYELF